MKSLLRYVALSALAFVAIRAAATTDPLIAAVTAADDERVAASLAADHARLEVILSDDLRYAHSNGKVDTKASYVGSIASHRSVYTSYDYQSRIFLPAAPGVVLMSGRVLINAGTVENKNLLDLNFLAVWREENGKWRFLAWQSCRNPAPPAK